MVKAYWTLQLEPLYLARPALSEMLPRVSSIPRQPHAGHGEGSKTLYYTENEQKAIVSAGSFLRLKDFVALYYGNRAPASGTGNPEILLPVLRPGGNCISPQGKLWLKPRKAGTARSSEPSRTSGSFLGKIKRATAWGISR